MALQYKINMFETDGSDANKTLVSFIVEDNVSHEKFAISRSIKDLNFVILELEIPYK